jgi:tetratricopeptide (TPR) repeat protein
MDRSPPSSCRLCHNTPIESVEIEGLERLCLDCLLAGKFINRDNPTKLSTLAGKLLNTNQKIQGLVGEAVGKAEQLAQAKDYQAAREHLLLAARTYFDQQKPILATIIMYRALRLPGQSAEVYELLGLTAKQMGCRKEALQHLKTAGWLAKSAHDNSLTKRILSAVLEIDPEDEWAQKIAVELERGGNATDPCCSFCERPASEVGPLVEGAEASICSICVRQLMSLDGDRH